ncbi:MULTISPECIES: histone-like nucleoid-structuring protein [unclassified Cupriavidus]|uniref:histone-like nucleoid-structuring protein n=1 Tax=Cupriavidus sp. H19C3 TaxID=3241603 RepID=UPI003BF80F2A
MSESESAKQAAVTWIHEQMDRHGLTFDDLVEAGCFAHLEGDEGADGHEGLEGHEGHEGRGGHEPRDSEAAGAATPARATPLYRNAMGQTWDGTGEYPDWLQRAVNAGQSIDFYRVD